MEIEEEIRHKVEWFLSKADQNHMGTALGIKFTKITKEEVCGTMPVNENTVQPFRILHGGASVALAETLCSIGAWINVPDDKSAVGLEINANHVRAVPEGKEVHALAKPIHIGLSTQVWEIKIYDEREKLVCVSRCTMAVVKKSRES